MLLFYRYIALTRNLLKPQKKMLKTRFFYMVRYSYLYSFVSDVSHTLIHMRFFCLCLKYGPSGKQSFAAVDLDWVSLWVSLCLSYSNTHKPTVLLNFHSAALWLVCKGYFSLISFYSKHILDAWGYRLTKRQSLTLNILKPLKKRWISIVRLKGI